MAKKDILLSVMSIIAIAFAGILLFQMGISAIPIVFVGLIFGFLEDFFIFTIFLINILILGILGLICVLKHIYASGCLIYGGILSLLIIANMVYDIFNASFMDNVIVLICLVLYTAGAAVAYIDSKKDRNL